jgi:hypothetical protein
MMLPSPYVFVMEEMAASKSRWRAGGIFASAGLSVFGGIKGKV